MCLRACECQVRAVAKATPLLVDNAYFTGNPEDDTLTQALVARLTRVEVPHVLKGFDETQMFQVGRWMCGWGWGGGSVSHRVALECTVPCALRVGSV